MKRLILVRHAKAEIADYEKTDVQRKLIQRGINDAGLMANMINENIPMPSLIVSSNAVRAYQTACIIGEKIGYNVCSIKKIPDFYENVSASDILTFANNEPRCSDSLMVVGHNPWITYVAQHLADRFRESMPTCALVVLEFDALEWDLIEPHSGKVVQYEYPKKYND